MDTERLGSSAKTAVVVATLWAEYIWLEQHRSGWIVVRRNEMHEAERLLDILTIESNGSAVEEIYFDVSACFTDAQLTPPCPYCGERLATAKARQCGSCLADFHDPVHVIYRRGREYVERVRETSARRRESEARAPGLSDPRAAFHSQFRPVQVAVDVYVLHFPSRLSAIDERVSRIGVECLIADGCRGVVCHLNSPGHIERLAASEDPEWLGLVLRRIVQFYRVGVRVVMVGGDELVKAWPAKVPPILSENCLTEELAIARLISELSSIDAI